MAGLFRVLENLDAQPLCDELLDGTPIPNTVFQEPKTLIPSREMAGLYHRASFLSGERSIGLRAGASLRFREVGTFGAYVSQAPTLLEAFHRIRACLGYYSSCGTINVSTVGDELIVESYNANQELTGFRQTGDVAVAIMWGLAQEYLLPGSAPIRT
ncbi:MAG: AraC family transcriptional regulator ligand-binding domain-containing protein, partial [Myxococcota bacterium]